MLFVFEKFSKLPTSHEVKNNDRSQMGLFRANEREIVKEHDMVNEHNTTGRSD